MTKQSILSIFATFICVISTLPAQVTFQKNIGSTGNEVGRSIIVLPDGYLLGGHITYDNDVSNTDALLLKTDLSGNVLWSKSYGGDDLDVFIQIIPTPDGGVIGLGESKSYHQGIRRGFIVKTGPDGEEIWSRTIGNAGETEGHSVVSVTDGVVVAGRMDGNAYLIKFDLDGNQIWSKNYFPGFLRCQYAKDNILYAAGTNISTGVFLKVDATTGSIISKTSWSGGVKDVLAFCYPSSRNRIGMSYQSTSSTGGNKSELWLNVTDTFGTVIWSKTYGNAQHNVVGVVRPCSDGGFMLMPFSIDADGDGAMIKVDANGEVEWSRQYGGPYYERIVQCEQTPDGGYIFIGDGRVENNGQINNQILLIKTNKEGVVDGCDALSFPVTAQTYSPALVNTAATASNSGLSGELAVTADLVLLEDFFTCTSDVKEVTTAQQILPKVQVTPNPADQYWQFRLENAASFRNLVIYAADGRLVFQQQAGDVISIDVPCRELPSGTYFYQVATEQGALLSGQVQRI